MTVWFFLLACFLAGFALSVGWWIANRILSALFGWPTFPANP